MSGSPKLPKEIRTQLGIGTLLIIVSIIWFSVILYFVTPDQILPTNENVRSAYDALGDIASIPYSFWTLKTIGLLIEKFIVWIFLDILFVIARYGGLTLLFLGGFAVFEAISNLRKARR